MACRAVVVLSVLRLGGAAEDGWSGEATGVLGKCQGKKLGDSCCPIGEGCTQSWRCWKRNHSAPFECILERFGCNAEVGYLQEVTPCQKDSRQKVGGVPHKLPSKCARDQQGRKFCAYPPEGACVVKTPGSPCSYQTITVDVGCGIFCASIYYLKTMSGRCSEHYLGSRSTLDCENASESETKVIKKEERSKQMALGISLGIGIPCILVLVASFVCWRRKLWRARFTFGRSSVTGQYTLKWGVPVQQVGVP